ncbi:MBL fold metallo-hydrolase [Solimonas marina]|uniref:MBL fold metallo-hydrolase n=1 Tax=Solimonas marina TaxID=2714601 RepID=A0A969W8W0_9GAMM|nr:MBL fold metallo-hydrolase [Solimonas marina]NKF22138.1 MBL fold metallo-hydrolase [Solimonas marina]
MAYRNPYYDPARSHHRPHGFVNPGPERPIGGDFWRWRRERRAAGVPKPPAAGYPAFTAEWRVDADFSIAERDPQPRIWWLGHACLLLRIGGLWVLTDPVLGARASPLSFAGPARKLPAAAAVDALPPIDVVLISHSHYDHLDRGTVRALVRRAQRGGYTTKFFTPLGLAATLKAFGADDVDEYDWWDGAAHHGLDIRCVPAQHWSARTPWDRNRTLWCGWTVHADNTRVYFAGDIGWWDGIAEIPQRVGAIDLAALPIGAYAPRWFMQGQHIDPAEAVRAHRILGARHSLAIHWGVFELADDALDEPPQLLRAALADAGLSERDFWLLRQGESRALAANP